MDDVKLEKKFYWQIRLYETNPDRDTLFNLLQTVYREAYEDGVDDGLGIKHRE